ncbi:DISARM system helicase DrmA [Sorangium sp. So ce367]|uniref:DISARM system helicase DrmA n=1 Tax=Sorangium sp. So ce367 TaxID=3133305 RepID=UPI003F630DBF
MEPVDVRERLVEILREDLVGPAVPDERLAIPPSRWYLTGFLVPFEGDEGDRVDPEAQEEPDEIGDDPRAADARAPDPTSRRRVLLPASLGLSVLVPSSVRNLRVTATWGDYAPEAPPACQTTPPRSDEADETRPVARPWRRAPREVTRELLVDPAGSLQSYPLETGESGLTLVVLSRRRADGDGLTVSVFLVNRRPPGSPRDAAFAFQAALALHCEEGLTARPNLRGRDDGRDNVDADEQVAELQYRDAVEHAVGHNVATAARLDEDGVCRRVETVWIPSAEVERVVPATLEGLDARMEALASVPDLRAALSPIADAYKAWIEQQAAARLADEAQRPMLEQLLRDARCVQGRIAEGIAALADERADAALRITCRVMAQAARARRPTVTPAWYPFQLAFVLMNVPGIVHPQDTTRRDVDLLFFPTGGGKTEAYLGLAAFTLVYRRLRHPGVRGAGVSVLMRYTLRLLTLDQLERAAALMCALEIAREADPRLGTWPFEIGLWVGEAATPNRMGRAGDRNPHSAREKTLAFRLHSGRNPSPIPIERCPWCHQVFKPLSFRLLPDDEKPERLDVYCASASCRWSSRPLPIVAVDEPIYRRLPCFLIATVDKIAQLPWVGETGALFGRVTRYDAEGFYGPCDRPGIGTPIPGGRLPPLDLVIQDELHLISGPLGTMVGLYETAVDGLCAEGEAAPKVVASTATVRRAARQIQALFARDSTVVFPPPGPDRKDSFFAKTVPAPRTPEERADTAYAHARRYVGVAAPGRSLKKVMLQVSLALLAGAQQLYEEAGGDAVEHNSAAPYMTLLGYFNSLRELGGSRRIIEDEVATRLRRYDERQRPERAAPVFARRSMGEVVELTSREPTSRISASRQRLEVQPRAKTLQPVDVALATNMISVGLDIPRLGLMMVAGQPRATAEYIQATSRVGRDPQRPGLVVTLLNVHRPRDRSHYERFEAYHASFYRAVEATSVTPFSPRAIDRGGAAVLVALTRLLDPRMTPEGAAAGIGRVKPLQEQVEELLRQRVAEAISSEERAALHVDLGKRAQDLFDSWSELADEHTGLRYARAEKKAPTLLYDPLAERPTNDDREKFRAPRSLRDVEPIVALRVQVPELPEET